MKDIRIKSITLENFKCFGHETFEFDGKNVVVSGENGTGKTTIGDAIVYCLFGKNLAGLSTFDIKTHDREGNTIPHLDHSVELVLVDGTSFKRVLKENWVKKRGGDELVFKDNTTDYFVNGDLVTSGDYKKFISSLVSEDVFRFITNPTTFTALNWKDQRQFLSQLVGEITDEEVVSSCPTLDGLKKKMGEQTLAEYRKHIAYNIKKVKEELAKIPIRLQTLASMKPEVKDWDALREELESKKATIKDIDDKISLATNDSGVLRVAEITKELSAINERMMAIKRETLDKFNKEEADRTKNLCIARNKFLETSKNISDLNDKISSYAVVKKRCEETIANCDNMLDKLRIDWTTNASRILQLNEQDMICPTCGRALTREMIDERVTELSAQLNKDKAARKEELSKEAEEIKKTKADAQAHIKQIGEDKINDEEKVKSLKDELNDHQKEISKYEEPIKSEMERLMENEEYIDLLAKEDKLKSEKDMPTTPSSDNTSYISEKKSLNESIEALQVQLADEKTYLSILEREAKIEEEKKKLVKQLSDLERDDDDSAKYQEIQSTILEDRVNGKFSLVTWKMFRTVNNGGDPYTEPYCECYVDGTAYHNGLNRAAQLNAGLDIINMLCDYYETAAPILIDNAESSNYILTTKGQQIWMKVTNEKLNIQK